MDHHSPTEASEGHLSPLAPGLCPSIIGRTFFRDLQGHSLIGGEVEAQH